MDDITAMNEEGTAQARRSRRRLLHFEDTVGDSGSLVTILGAGSSATLGPYFFFALLQWIFVSTDNRE